MIIKRGRLTESGVELGGLGFIGDIQGFWKRAPFILVTGIAHIWWLAQLTAVPVQYKFVLSVLNVFDYEWYSYFYSW